jgi:hypothetical protein
MLDRRWVGESGNMGNPALATVENGRRIVERTVQVGVQILSVLDQQAGLEASRQP